MKTTIINKINSIKTDIPIIDKTDYQKVDIMLQSHSGQLLDQSFGLYKDSASLIGDMVNKQLGTKFDFNYEPIRIHDKSLSSFFTHSKFLEIDSTHFKSFQEEGSSEPHYKKDEMKDIGVFFIRNIRFSQKLDEDNNAASEQLSLLIQDIHSMIIKEYGVSIEMISFLMNKKNKKALIHTNPKLVYISDIVLNEYFEQSMEVLNLVEKYKLAINTQQEV